MIDNKQIKRQQIRQIKANYSPFWLLDKSQMVCKKILDWSVFRHSTNIFVYLAMPDELNLDTLIKTALFQGKNIFVPYVSSKQERIMQAVALEDLDFVEVGEHNIRTIKAVKTPICPDEIDLVLVPGLGFSASGARLGVGGGYYDRFLPKAKNAAFAGITLKKQIFPSLFCQKNDVFMDYVISEFQIINCQKMRKQELEAK